MRTMRNHADRLGSGGGAGFTMIEVLLVLAILVMLATVAIMALGGTREGAKIDTTRLLIQEVENAMETYNLHVGHYPTESEGGIDALVAKPTVADEAVTSRWRGPYLKRQPMDGWNRPLNYQPVETGDGSSGALPMRIWSNGPDGRSGTGDDIRNWSDGTG